MDRSPRRSFFLALPQMALMAACAFGAASASTAKPRETASLAASADALGTAGAAGAGSTAGAGTEVRDRDEPGSQEPMATVTATRRALPLPMEEDRTWLQEWLDLISLPGYKSGVGC